MKQTILALAFVAIAFASCKNQTEAPLVEDATKTVTEQLVPVVNTNAELVGTWIQPKPNSTDKSVTHGFELKEDGTVVSVNVDGMKFNKWKLVDDNTIVFEGEMVGNDPATVESTTFTYELIDSKVLKITTNGETEEFTKL